MAVTAVTQGGAAGSPPTDTIATNPWRTPGAGVGKIAPMAPWSVPSFLLGLHVLQGIAVGMQVPPGTAATSKLMDTMPDPIKGSTDIKRLVPRKRQLKPQRLLRRLGKEFDDFWMSKDLPSDFLEITSKRNLDDSLVPESHNLDTSNLILNLYLDRDFPNRNATQTVAAGNESTVKTISNALERMSTTMRTWLVELSSCPVYYQWEDLGLLYWPRWVRKGMCSPPETEWNSDSSQTSSSSSSSSPSSFSSAVTSSDYCSWPPGMHCVPNRAKKLKILHWVCRPAKGSDIFHSFRQSGRRKPFARRTRNDGEDRKEEPIHNNDDLLARAGSYYDNQDFKRLIPDNERESFRGGASHEGKEEGDPFPGSDPRRKKLNLPPSFTQNMHKWTGIRTRSKRSRADDGINKTEDWNKRKWKGRRKRPHVRCRWVKIPYPVIDDCYCSC